MTLLLFKYVIISILKMKIEVSNGEIIDKYTILCIKLEKIKNLAKLEYIKKEHDYLKNKISEIGIENKYIIPLLNINEKIWEIEDNIRLKEQKKEFDDEFINYARDVYINNDKRAELKYKINRLTKSNFCEIKELPTINS